MDYRSSLTVRGFGWFADPDEPAGEMLKVPHQIDADGGEASPLPMNGIQPGDAFRYPRLLPDHDRLLLTRETDDGPKLKVVRGGEFVDEARASSRTGS
jgi:hypothetical protein